MNEADLMQSIRNELRRRPALAWHHCCRPHYACMGHPGFPDLIIIGNRLIIREVKGDDTRTPRHQADYGRRLRLAGIDWAIWGAADLESGLIAAELDSLIGVPLD